MLYLRYSLKSLSSIVFLTYPPFAPFLYRVRPTHAFAYQLHTKIVNVLRVARMVVPRLGFAECVVNSMSLFHQLCRRWVDVVTAACSTISVQVSSPGAYSSFSILPVLHGQTHLQATPPPCSFLADNPCDDKDDRLAGDYPRVSPHLLATEATTMRCRQLQHV